VLRDALAALFLATAGFLTLGEGSAAAFFPGRAGLAAAGSGGLSVFGNSFRSVVSGVGSFGASVCSSADPDLATGEATGSAGRFFGGIKLT